MTRLAPARKVALHLVGERRRRDARLRDLARTDQAMQGLSAQDRALALRLALGATAASAVIDALVDAYVRRPSSLEPRVRDALRLAAYELCYLETPSAVAASQGVELVRAVAPRAAGMANTVLRRLAEETRPRVAAARACVRAGDAAAGDLSLASGLPAWLVDRLLADRGAAATAALCAAQLEPAPVYVAANGLRHDADGLASLLCAQGMDPQPLTGLPGSFVLGDATPLSASGLVEGADLAVCDVSAQLVCRLAAPAAPGPLLEVGQGRGTKSLLLAAAVGAVHPTRIEAVDSVGYKVRLSRRRMEAAGLAGLVACSELDACRLADADLPAALRGPFAASLVDAPCSGTGTMRRHPEIPAALSSRDVADLADLQLRMLSAASARVAVGGVLTYATCSVLRAEDEAVVAAFLASAAGRGFAVRDVLAAPACQADRELAARVTAARTPEGYLLTTPALGAGDGHFCACLVRVR